MPQPNGRRPIKFYPDPKPLKDARPGYATQQMAGTGGHIYVDDEEEDGIGTFEIGVSTIG